MIPLKSKRMTTMNIIMEEAAVVDSMTLNSFMLERHSLIGWQTSEGPLIRVCINPPNPSIFLETFRCQYGSKRGWTYVHHASSVIECINQITKNQHDLN